MIVKTIILNVSNSGDSSYRETFTIFHDKKHESDFEIEKNNWEDWCNSERENINYLYLCLNNLQCKRNYCKV